MHVVEVPSLNDPGSHKVISPVSKLQDLPELQLTQKDDPALSVNKFSLQAILTPFEQEYPISHLVHSEAPSLEYSPLSQVIGYELSAVQ